MKTVLIIGLGRFGRHMARKFIEQKNEVLGVDHNEERVNDALEYLTSAQIGDSTNERFIASLGIKNFDLCVVAIGDNFQSSIETAALLKDAGAKFVFARASRDVHAKFLLRNGADEIVYAEKDVAERLAVKFGADNIFDYIELTPDYSIYEIIPPSIWIGNTIINMEIRSRYNISILGTKKDGIMNPMPTPNYVFNKEETLIVMGHNADVLKVTQLKYSTN
ncbi:MAG: potassium channel family protein [Anaerotignaceae bacterium]